MVHGPLCPGRGAGVTGFARDTGHIHMNSSARDGAQTRVCTVVTSSASSANSDAGMHFTADPTRVACLVTNIAVGRGRRGY